MRRRRVDWDEEIRKTDRIRRRGLALSALSFAVALAVIFGAGRMGGVEVALPRKVVAIACQRCAGSDRSRRAHEFAKERRLMAAIGLYGKAHPETENKKDKYYNYKNQ